MLCCFFLRQASKAKNSTIFTIIRWDDWLTERLSGRLISQCIKINIGPLDVVPSNHRIKYIEDCRISKQISNSMNHKKKEPQFSKAKVLYLEFVWMSTDVILVIWIYRTNNKHGRPGKKIKFHESSENKATILKQDPRTFTSLRCSVKR